MIAAKTKTIWVSVPEAEFDSSWRPDVFEVKTPRTLIAGRVNQTLPLLSIANNCASDEGFGMGNVSTLPVVRSKVAIAFPTCSTNQILFC